MFLSLPPPSPTSRTLKLTDYRMEDKVKPSLLSFGVHAHFQLKSLIISPPNPENGLFYASVKKAGPVGFSGACSGGGLEGGAARPSLMNIQDSEYA